MLSGLVKRASNLVWLLHLLLTLSSLYRSVYGLVGFSLFDKPKWYDGGAIEVDFLCQEVYMFNPYCCIPVEKRRS